MPVPIPTEAPSEPPDAPTPTPAQPERRITAIKQNIFSIWPLHINSSDNPDSIQKIKKSSLHPRRAEKSKITNWYHAADNNSPELNGTVTD